MKKTLFVLFAIVLLVVGCNVGPLTSGPDQQTFTEAPSSLITSADNCEHQLMYFRNDGGAKIINPDEGTIYECAAGKVHESYGNEMVYSGHFIENTEGLSFSILLSKGHEIEVGGDGLVEISGDAKNLQMILASDDDDDDWVKVPGSGTYNVLKLRKVGHGHGRSTASSSVITTSDVVVVDGSGGNENS